jgi:hypothetical protein
VYLLRDKHPFPFFVIQVDENIPQQQSPSSSVIATTSDDNGSLSATTTSITAATTTKIDDRASPLNHHTLRKKSKLNIYKIKHALIFFFLISII